MVKMNPFYFQIAAARCPSCLCPFFIQSACISVGIALHGAKVTWKLWLRLVSLSEKTSEAITALEHVPYHAPSPPDAQLNPPADFLAVLILQFPMPSSTDNIPLGRGLEPKNGVFGLRIGLTLLELMAFQHAIAIVPLKYDLMTDCPKSLFSAAAARTKKVIQVECRRRRTGREEFEEQVLPLADEPETLKAMVVNQSVLGYHVQIRITWPMHSF